ncbi:MAG: peptide chain release factor N(5)-glutamine methyltransferase [bacterium]|nr:peptide chain release factor N(5)-glutamine methyltransferase [bacterium]MDE0418201.1 peptide chain release factor N(5)-glutamine methyltransferase [bacterium]
MTAASLDDALREATATLRASGVEYPAREARLLAELVVGRDDPRTLSSAEGRHLATLVARRARREPFAQIAGVREFWSLDFEVTMDTLIPRPDSETLIECCLDRFGRRPPARILDLGTGSGCLIVTLLVTWTGSSGIGVDVSERTCAVAARNVLRHGVGDRAWIVCGDWAGALDSTFDLVVANPPYVPGHDLAGLDPEVALHEPRLAIDGGVDGYACYRRIVPRLPTLLSRHGMAVIEHGPDQRDGLSGLASDHGLDVAGTADDLGGRHRVLFLAHREPWRKSLESADGLVTVR